MKKFGLFILLLNGTFLFCQAQTTHSNFVAGSEMQSKKPLVQSSDQPVVDPSTEKKLSANPTENQSQTRYLEYKVDQGNNQTEVKNQENEPAITVPIQAEGYTDPNYELNKQKSAEATQQMMATPAPEKSLDEMIIDLQNKIKAIKEGEITGCVATTKLIKYEEELKELLNKK